MENGEANVGTSRENVVSRSGHDSSASQNQNGNYRQRHQPRNVRYTRYRETSRYGHDRQNDRQGTDRVQQTDTSQQRQREQLNPDAESYDPRRDSNRPEDRNTEAVANRQGNSQ
jgi:hypothetical protein